MLRGTGPIQIKLPYGNEMRGIPSFADTKATMMPVRMSK